MLEHEKKHETSVELSGLGLYRRKHPLCTLNCLRGMRHRATVESRALAPFLKGLSRNSSGTATPAGKSPACCRWTWTGIMGPGAQSHLHLLLGDPAAKKGDSDLANAMPLLASGPSHGYLHSKVVGAWRQWS